MAIAFQSATSGSPNRSVTVPTGTDRLLVVVTFGGFITGTPTWNGVAMSIAHNSNDFCHIYYVLSPAEGANTMASAGAYTDVACLHYTGVGGFQAASGGTASTATISRTTSTDNALIVAGIAADAANFTPATSCNERYDGTGGNDGNCVVDRIAGAAGSYTVGVASATFPDIVACVFSEAAASAIDVSGSATFPLMTASGVVYEPNVSGAVTFPALQAAGVVYEPNVSGAVSFPALQATGTIDETDVRGSATFPALVADGIVYQPDVSGAVNFPVLVASGEVVETTVQGAVTFPLMVAAGVAYQPDVDGAVTFPALVAAGAVDELVVVSGAASFPSLVASGVVYEPNVSGAVTFAALVASGLVERVGEVRPPLTASSPHASVSASVAQGSAVASRAIGRVN